MDKKFIATSKKRLLEMKKEILADIMHESETIHELEGEESGDVADIAFDRIEKERHLELSSVESQKLKDINNALDRIKNNVYGHCEMCGKDINEKRLQAIPHAYHCISCQTQSERH